MATVCDDGNDKSLACVEQSKWQLQQILSSSDFPLRFIHYVLLLRFIIRL